MKKIITTFCLVLVGLFIFLSLLDSGEFAMEKKLWYAQKQYEALARDPKAVPDKSFQELADRYAAIIKRYPDASLTPKVYIKIGKIYLMKKDYGKARASYQEILKRYSKNDALCAEAILNVGDSYSIEGRNEQALREYQSVLERYPLTTIGINMPLYLADFHLRNKNAEESAAALRMAIGFYQKVAKENPNTPLEFEARWLLATTYLAQQKWETGVRSFGDILSDFSQSKALTPQVAMTIIKNINTISVSNLKNFDLPVEIYTNFIEKNPKHPLNGYLDYAVKVLTELKTKNLKAKATATNP